MKDTIVKTAKYNGVLNIGEVKLKCFVTEDGERYISGRSMTSAIGMKGRGQGAIRISTHTTLLPFMNNSLIMALENPVEIGNAKAFRAEILADLCDVILEARKKKSLRSEQEIRYAEYAENLIRGFARIGIVALVDEATGYQAVREKKALETIINKYITDTKERAWSKTFPDEFWFKLVKVKGYDSYIALKRPAFVGHWVNDIIYSRLAPGIKNALSDKAPRNTNGNRTSKFHEWLTSDFGLPELKDHIRDVMLIMDLSSSTKEFHRLLDKKFPKYGNTIEMELE